MKLNREVKIGLLMVLAFLTILWGISFLKGHDLLFAGDRYYGIYNRVDGLTDASPIYYKGFKIGSVRGIDIYDSEKVSFIVTFDISKDIKIPDNTVAQIYSLDLMGSKGVQFIEGDSKTYLSSGDTLRASLMEDIVDQMSMQVLPLKEKTEKLIVKLDSSLTKLDGFFSEDNKRHFRSTLEHISVSMANFAELSNEIKVQFEEDGKISDVIDNIDSFTKTLNGEKGAITETVKNMNEFSESLKKAEIGEIVGKLNGTLAQADSIIATVNNGEGTAGMLLHNKELYYRMADATGNLNRLITDVRHNPKRYVGFSVVNLGKKVYIQDNGLGTEGIVFLVVIKESKTVLDISGKELEPGLRIYQDFDGSRYIYSAGQANSYDEAKGNLERVKKYYPEAKIAAYEFGSEMKLKKAIRQTAE